MYLLGARRVIVISANLTEAALYRNHEFGFLSDDETTIERMDTLASTDERLDPEHAAQTGDAKNRFREVFAKLPRREREIAVLLYVKGMTLAEIGEILGVSESRVCQIHTQMKKTLRAELGDHEAILRLVA